MTLGKLVNIPKPQEGLMVDKSLYKFIFKLSFIIYVNVFTVQLMCVWCVCVCTHNLIGSKSINICSSYFSEGEDLSEGNLESNFRSTIH